MDKNRDKTVERPQNKNLKRDAGPGRPKGQKNFATIYREAIEKIAQSKGQTADQFEIEMAEQAIRKGFNGDTRFYTDTMDRVHGKAQQHVDIKSDGVALPTPILTVTKDVHINDSNTEDSSTG